MRFISGRLLLPPPRQLLLPLLLLLVSQAVFAHPGGGLIALNANTVIFGDSANNAVWRLEKGRKPQALISKFHAHWTVLGLDGHVYSEAFQEMGGALFRIDLAGTNHVKIAEETHVNAPVFAVGKSGELIFQRGGKLVQRTADGKMMPFRGSGSVAKGDPPLQQIIAYTWASDGTLWLADGNNLRRAGRDGVVRFEIKIDGKLLEPQIWNSTGAPRIWSIAIDDLKRVYMALPDTGKVVRFDPNRSQYVLDHSSVVGWRATAVAIYGDSVFLLESSDKTNAGQRVRVIRGNGSVELLGKVEP